MFTVLVARPGIGKGAAVNPVMDVMRKANTVNVLSDRLTIEFVLEKLANGFPPQMVGGMVPMGTDASCLIFAPELGVFARNSEHSLPDLSDLWDCREHPFVYGTRGKGEYTINKPCPSMLAGSSPRWLMDSIPGSAIGGGFTRRVNFVFGTEKSKNIPWPKGQTQGQRDLLVDDLRYIATHVRGEFKLDNAARPVFEKFYMSAKPDEFDDEATANYVSTKWVHAVKLGMALSAAQRDDRVILKEDLEEGIDHVEEIVTNVKKVFRATGESDLVSSTDKVLRYIEKKGYATYQELMAIMWRDVTKFELEVILQTLKDGNLITEATSGGRISYKANPQP